MLSEIISGRKTLISRMLIAFVVFTMVGVIGCSRDNSRNTGGMSGDSNNRIATSPPGSGDVGINNNAGDNKMISDISNMQQRMRDIDLSGYMDNDFARMMIEHHKGSIDISDEYLDNAKNSRLQAIAKRIKDSEDKEIDRLEEFTDSKMAMGGSNNKNKNEKADNSAEYKNRFMGMIDNVSSDIKSLKPSGDPEKDYAAIMIAHHREAIKMGNMYLDTGKNPRLKELVRKMISQKEKEINEFQQAAKSSNAS